MGTQFQFTDPGGYAYRDGMIFLGLDPRTGHEIGIDTERHLFAAAGSRAGKGACLIIPNLKRWKKAALVIDPKGENCEETWQDRERMGHVVRALDPFGEGDLPGHIRACFNPLDGIEAEGDRAREQVMALAEGMVIVHDPKHTEWVEGARAVIAGVIAFTIETTPSETRNLSMARALLMLPTETLAPLARQMMESDACGGLARAAGTIILDAVTNGKGMPPQFLDGARRASAWLDAKQIAACLSKSNFDLGDLKTDKLSLYLILPPDEIKTYGAFFRMFVQTSLKTMMRGGRKAKGECLFILDEFASLGRLDLVEEAAGRMPGYGVHLWPFVQQIGQLQKLYGREGAETFLGNADAHIYFNPQDTLTLEYISHRSGRFKPGELVDILPRAPSHMGGDDVFSRALYSGAEAEYKNELLLHADAMKLANTPRLTPSDIVALTGKGNNEKVARSMIVFAKAGDVLNLRLAPYFGTSATQTLVNRKFHDLTPGEWVGAYCKTICTRIFMPPNVGVLKETFMVAGLSFILSYTPVLFFALWAVHSYLDEKLPKGWKLDAETSMAVFKFPLFYCFIFVTTTLILHHWRMTRIACLIELESEAIEAKNENLARYYRRKIDRHAKLVRIIFSDYNP